MRTITLSEIKRRGSKAIPDGGPVYLIVNSKPKSVLVPVSEYESLVEALEELEDVRAVEARREEGTVRYEDAFPRP